MPKKAKKKYTNKSGADSTEELRKTYLDNRARMLEDFEASLTEVQRPKPSTTGEIMGMNFQQFSAVTLFRSIKDQEEYIDYAKEYDVKYVVLAEEEKILKDMIKKVKAVFGKDYDGWMKAYGK